MAREGGTRGDRAWILARVGALVLAVIIAAAAGFWLGGESVYWGRKDQERRPVGPAESVPVMEMSPLGESPVSAPPLYMFADTEDDDQWPNALDEIGLAVQAGLGRFVVPVELPWTGECLDTALERIRSVGTVYANAAVLLRMALDPPAAWLDAHPDERLVAGGESRPYASIASEVWFQSIQDGLSRFITALNGAPDLPTVCGYMPVCLESRSWQQPSAYDTSPPNVARFRRWLTERYPDDASLQAAWGIDTVTLETATVPDATDAEPEGQAFFAMPGERARIDYADYVSTRTAEVIAAVAAHVKKEVGDTVEVIVPYGFAFEQSTNASGHNGIGRVLESAVDGLAGPLSYADRQLGGSAGPVGLVDTIAARGKRWYVLDDTRTGVTRDPSTGALNRIPGLRAQDVCSLLERNFGAAMAQGTGVIWIDPGGQGALAAPDLWGPLGAMCRAYGEDVASVGDLDVWPRADTCLAVVVDEASRSYTCSSKLEELVLTRARDTALTSGVPIRFYLLEDVLSGAAPPATLYLFANSFKLSADARAKLHGLLAENKAVAIWLYAPGFIDETPDAENIALTVRMAVKAFEGPAVSGSAYELAGAWLEKGDAIGEPLTWSPLFYIDDEEVDVIAKYRESGKPSAAMAFFEEGWASVYLAEPWTTPGLLREILRILEKHIYFLETTPRRFDAAYLGRNLLAIHGRDVGERAIALDPLRLWDVQDLLVPEIGWHQQRNFMLPLRAGETRLLRLTPATIEHDYEPSPEEEAPDEETQEEVQGERSTEDG
ncbi:MAG TPA: hypothetical protein PLO37_05975 [Candidatus Hydrogenedentes bacterium]|nr:hypothetical protein [Candidatus Hydrogenedentota bacterium]HPG66377.1 hypothetical protein [Candidatus Hydrogenedentota bacterium]